MGLIVVYVIWATWTSESCTQCISFRVFSDRNRSKSNNGIGTSTSTSSSEVSPVQIWYSEWYSWQFREKAVVGSLLLWAPPWISPLLTIPGEWREILETRNQKPQTPPPLFSSPISDSFLFGFGFVYHSQLKNPKPFADSNLYTISIPFRGRKDPHACSKSAPTMKVSLRKCKLPLLLFFPCRCLHHTCKHDGFVSSQPRPDKASLQEKKPMDEEEGVNSQKDVVILKSSLKKDIGFADSIVAEKRNVRWMDFLGKDLVQIREFEPMYGHLLLN